MSLHRTIAALLPTSLALGLALTACNPATISRIGPAVPARGPDCEIEVLDDDQAPSRPYRDLQ